MVHQLVIHGKKDQEIRQRVLSRNTNGDLTTLAKLVDYIKAEEAVVSESNDLNTHYLVPRGHQEDVKNSRKNISKCGWCEGPKHTQTNSEADRQKLCRAGGKTCDICKKPSTMEDLGPDNLVVKCSTVHVLLVYHYTGR